MKVFFGDKEYPDIYLGGNRFCAIVRDNKYVIDLQWQRGQFVFRLGKYSVLVIGFHVFFMEEE